MENNKKGYICCCFSVAQVVSDSLQPHGLQYARLPCPSSSPRSLLKLRAIELVMPSNHLIICHPLLLLPSIFLSIRVCSNELALHIRWPKYWSFSFSISSSASLVAQTIKNLPAMQETWVWFLVWEDPKWQPTPVFLPRESPWTEEPGGCSLWGCKELDVTEQLTHTHTHTHVYNWITLLYTWN